MEQVVSFMRAICDACPKEERWKVDRMGIRPWLHKVRESLGQVTKYMIAKAMQILGLSGQVRTKSTRPKRKKNADRTVYFPDVLARKFQQKKPYRAFTSDSTSVRCGNVLCSALFIRCLCSREILGWATGYSPCSQMTLRALKLFSRNLPVRVTDAIFHSDKGSEFACHDVQTVLRDLSLTISMSPTGDCASNASSESVNARFKVECIYRVNPQTYDAFTRLVDEYVYFNNEEREFAVLNHHKPVDVRNVFYPNASPIYYPGR